MQLRDILEGLMPTYITTEAEERNQEPAESALIAQDSDKLNLQIGLKTMKSNMGKLISVQEIQVDPCGSGWENLIQRQQSHIYIF